MHELLHVAESKRYETSERRLVGVVVMCVALAFCGGSSPTAPSASQSGGGSGPGTGSAPTGGGGGTASPTACRTGVATYRIVTTSSAVTSTVNGSCTFNPTAVEGTCTNQYSDSTGQNFTSVSTTRNATRGDVVDEVSVIPPLNLSVSTVTTLPIAGQGTTTLTATRTFSGRRLLTNTSVSQPSLGPPSVTTYLAWDAADRPTAGTVVTGGQSVPQSFTYDNATRTQTSTSAGATCTQTFDQNGNPAVGTCSGATATTTVLATQQICR